MPYGLENKFNIHARRAMDAYNENNFKSFADSVQRLDAAYLDGLLEYVCRFPRSERTMRRPHPLAVLWESLIENKPRAAVIARHEWLRTVNADIEMSIAVDAILGTRRASPAAVAASCTVAQQRGYSRTAGCLRTYDPR